MVAWADAVTAHDGLPVASDLVFQRQLRRLQSTWREEQGLPIGTHRGRPLGSRIALPRPIVELRADDLANYLTPTIRELVHHEVTGMRAEHDKLYGVPRIFDDLLSSQPLCFNLFGELAADVRAATDVAKLLWPARVAEVTSIEFEHSPGSTRSGSRMWIAVAASERSANSTGSQRSARSTARVG